MAMRALYAPLALLALPFFLACPTESPSVDSGTPPPDSGRAESADPEDAGALDAGSVDASDGAEDAGSDAGSDVGSDAGFVCVMPAIEPPPELAPDAGPPDCALDNVEGSTGHFEGTWEGVVFGAFPFTGAFELPARGEMDFEIYCGDDKLLVDGILEGRAYQHPDAGPDEPGHPFSGRLYGEYSLATGVVTMLVNPATLTVGPLTGTFQVAMDAHRVNDAFEDGAWCGVTISPEGGAGEGSWRADLR